LDRFGQTSEKIFVFNMRVPGTIESDIFERLYHRIGVFRHSIGDLEPILRDEIRSITRTLLDPRLTDEERKDEADRVGVALAERSQQLKDLEDSRGALSTVEQLKVDGMGESGPTDGRYVGPSESRRLVERLLARCGGSLSEPNRQGICRLVGSEELAQAVRKVSQQRSGSLRPVGRLAADLRDEVPIRVTFDSDTASKFDVELISPRHPLVSAALGVLDDSTLSLCRFAVVGVDDLAVPESGCLCKLDLVHSTGLQPRLELWVTAVALDGGEALPELGGHLLEAAAQGRLRDVDVRAHPAIETLLSKLDEEVSSRRREVQAQRRRDNDALIEARIASRRSSIELKIDRAQRTLTEVISRERDPRVIRMHEGRIKNLRVDLDDMERDLSERREMHMTVSPVAVLQVHPSGQ
jgi:hypothetical protein